MILYYSVRIAQRRIRVRNFPKTWQRQLPGVHDFLFIFLTFCKKTKNHGPRLAAATRILYILYYNYIIVYIYKICIFVFPGIKVRTTIIVYNTATADTNTNSKIEVNIQLGT